MKPRSKTWKAALAAMITGMCQPGLAVADDRPVINASIAYYLDSRQFSTVSAVLSTNRLPLGVSIWGFTDFHGDHDSNSSKLTRSFSEYRLSHAGLGEIINLPGLGLQVESNAVTGSGNDIVRAGFTYRHNLPLPWLKGSDRQGFLQWRAFPYESDNNGGQVSLIFKLPITEQVQITGFADNNIIESGEDRWVTETELSVRIRQKFWVLLEYRYNEFEDSNPEIRGSAVALGMRYHFSK